MSHRFCLVVAILGVVAASATAGEPAKPVIIADDLGCNDVGWHGSEIKTPNLDKLAKNGVVLDRHYVYPTCSPTRAGILTGRNPSRFNIHGPIAGKSELALPMDTLTISRLLQTRGYVTALIGKWHLGLRPEVGPRRFGFDFTYGYFHGQLDPLTHRYHGGEQTWHRNDQYVEEKGHVTDLIAEEAVKFIERPPGEGGRKPFFLWMAHATPHYPLTEEEKGRLEVDRGPLRHVSPRSTDFPNGIEAYRD